MADKGLIDEMRRATERVCKDVLVRQPSQGGDLVATTPISSDTEFNSKLTAKILTIGDLGIYIRFRYGNYKVASQKVGISENRVRQIANGFYLPKTMKLISKISRGWEIDPIILTQLFERERREDKK